MTTETIQKHTPGPWRVKPDDSGVVYGPPHSHPQSVRLEPIVCFVRGYTGSTEAEANARLIAAAPELLEALKDLIANSEHLSPFGLRASVQSVRLAGKYMNALKAAQAAIAKAEGN